MLFISFIFNFADCLEDLWMEELHGNIKIKGFEIILPESQRTVGNYNDANELLMLPCIPYGSQKKELLACSDLCWLRMFESCNLYLQE